MRRFVCMGVTAVLAPLPPPFQAPLAVPAQWSPIPAPAVHAAVAAGLFESASAYTGLRPWDLCSRASLFWASAFAPVICFRSSGMLGVVYFYDCEFSFLRNS